MPSALDILQLEQLYALKEINEKLSQIILVLQDLNELASKGSDFSKLMDEAKRDIDFMHKYYVASQITSRKRTSHSIQIIEHSKNSSINLDSSQK